MFTMGGLSGVMHASPPVDLQQTDTYFVVAHFHYVLFGGSIFGLFSGAY
jgi:cytochrome c oxidase subunit 1